MHKDFLQEASRGCLLFLLYNQIDGELVIQAERKVRPSTHIPDLDNANVGTFCVRHGKLPDRRFPVFLFQEVELWSR